MSDAYHRTGDSSNMSVTQRSSEGWADGGRELASRLFSISRWNAQHGSCSVVFHSSPPVDPAEKIGVFAARGELWLQTVTNNRSDLNNGIWVCREARERRGGERGLSRVPPHPTLTLPAMSSQNVVLTYPDWGYLTMLLKPSFSAAPNIALALGLFSSRSPCSSRAAKLNHIAHCGFYCLPTSC